MHFLAQTKIAKIYKDETELCSIYYRDTGEESEKKNFVLIP